MVIPTFNSPEVLMNMLTSLHYNTDWEGRVIVVNNGEPLPQMNVGGSIEIFQPGKNLGWMGGVNHGLWHAETEFFCMSNDDLVFPVNLQFWQHLRTNMYDSFTYTHNGGVAPTSNYVSGCQNILFHTKSLMVEAPYLIGMLAMYRTKTLKDLKGLDESLPGGDDLDLSIRVKDLGQRLICVRSCYVHHIGSQTGRREAPQYWDSREHQVATTNALIKKHGMKKWADCWMGVPKPL